MYKIIPALTRQKLNNPSGHRQVNSCRGHSNWRRMNCGYVQQYKPHRHRCRAQKNICHMIPVIWNPRTGKQICGNRSAPWYWKGVKTGWTGELGNVDQGGGSTAAVHAGNHQLILETSALDTLHTCTLHLNETGKTRLKCWKTHVCLLQLPGS